MRIPGLRYHQALSLPSTCNPVCSSRPRVRTQRGPRLKSQEAELRAPVAPRAAGTAASVRRKPRAAGVRLHGSVPVSEDERVHLPERVRTPVRTQVPRVAVLCPGSRAGKGTSVLSGRGFAKAALLELPGNMPGGRWHGHGGAYRPALRREPTVIVVVPSEPQCEGRAPTW